MKLAVTSLLILFAVPAKLQILNTNSVQNSVIDLGEVIDGNQDYTGFSSLKDVLSGVEVVMLGEQTHGEGTVYDTKIKLIKYLHEEMDFDLLVFESSLYECNKAWELIENGEDVRIALGNSVFALWSVTKEFKPLASYIDSVRNTESELKVFGFDSNFSNKYGDKYFLQDLKSFLKNMNSSLIDSVQWTQFSESINHLTKKEFKKLKRQQVKSNLAYLSDLIEEIENSPGGSETEFWIQTLKSTYTSLSDIGLKTELRDHQMAENLLWIMKQNPNKKIICWGATSHFLYDAEKVKVIKNPAVKLFASSYYKKHSMMGDYIKDELQERVFSIGFTAYEGEFGLMKGKKIKSPIKGSLESLLFQLSYNNLILPFKGLDLNPYPSRPLGHVFMKNPINGVMDAVIFNREIKRPTLDRNLFLTIYPSNKHIKPEIED